MRWMLVPLVALIGCSGDDRMLVTSTDNACEAPGTCDCTASARASCEEETGDGDADDEEHDDNTAEHPDPVDREPTNVAQGCEPGLYTGMYNCTIDIMGSGPIPLTGKVQFELEVNEEVVTCPAGAEFCEDLVIGEGTGTLAGVVFGLVGFKTGLKGGLDCQTGEFKAEAASGIYGLPIPVDANDLEGEWTIAEPPAGTFDGTLEGSYVTTPPEKIMGTWSLADVGSGVACTGPWEVTRMP